ncbi:MAG: DUF58 domain-containing protein [Motiliproteus sp.]|nr:DUF58 domain-containing protein [Motiliproteus sp.]MCW9051069.1 DUF58 domain-containing protein [Motiliproteus sp.]
MFSLLRRPRAIFQQWSEDWLSRRLPKSRSLTLNQRRIFILPTRDGLGYLMMLTAIFIGGINYANSLMLGIAFLLVSLFLISILHTYGNLSGLQISAGRTENAFVGEDAVFWLSLQGAAKQQHESIRLTWQSGAGELVDLIESPQQQVRMLLPVHQRGHFSPKRLKIETCFPLGLLRAWSWIDMDMSCLVYPKPIKNAYPESLYRNGEEGDQLVQEGSDDFDGLKDYVAGDNPRHIAWKNYARSGDLYSKVFVGYEDHERWLDWQAYGDEIELRLSKLSYWVVRLRDQDHSFGLRLPGIEIAPGRGEQHARHCLEALALYQSQVLTDG